MTPIESGFDHITRPKPPPIQKRREGVKIETPTFVVRTHGSDCSDERTSSQETTSD